MRSFKFGNSIFLGRPVGAGASTSVSAVMGHAWDYCFTCCWVSPPTVGPPGEGAFFPVTMESIPPKCHWWSSFNSGMNRGFDIQDGGDCCTEEYADSIQSQMITMPITYRLAGCKRLAFDFGMTCFVAATGDKDSCINRSSQVMLVFANGRHHVSFRRPSFVPNMENTGRLRVMPRERYNSFIGRTLAATREAIAPSHGRQTQRPTDACDLTIPLRPPNLLNSSLRIHSLVDSGRRQGESTSYMS